MRILLIEPFGGGSHRALVESLTKHIDAEWTVLTLPARHWKWRMRGSAAYFAERHRESLESSLDLVLVSSFLPLAELVGLVPALGQVPRILYFHENQWDYPSRDPTPSHAQRDHHFGFTQMVSALAATHNVFNSDYNRTRFVTGCHSILRRMPDAVPTDWVSKIEGKSSVLPVPLEVPAEFPRIGGPAGEGAHPATGASSSKPESEGVESEESAPIVLWNHRWEHDKGPEVFLQAITELASGGTPFRVVICGEQFSERPPEFASARQVLGDRVLQFGYVESRSDYWSWLQRADLVVSTARHEYQGLSVLEAVHAGARPLVPDRLVYPEIYPREFRYSNDEGLLPALRHWIDRWHHGEALRQDRSELTRPFVVETVIPRFQSLFERAVRDNSVPGDQESSGAASS